ncbi:MAG: hypothetical protein KJ856_22445 [Gammaproteobacteria bacterium]|uniref:Uncharacterized protein n=1 Tax=viral metagenome TaxID=1070528 RepID=A0A6M3KMX7_9ZZZZ|nr:hypothetical protein [Gammaproteobacteria bacterium]MBU1505946.1 hypothetical protein [Gammaproteobacteria bacterium]MBU2119874.1 hypothetical protein [Gammaproteobacteria bacterium]MBU2189748.1 hypothetical protein [Gammaproteobacteria bacterium]
MTDVAVLSETQRQGEATRAALGVQMRARPLWSGAGGLSGVPVRYVAPYRLRGANSPELLYENIVHNGAVYVAEAGSTTNVYTSADLKAWTARPVDASSALAAGRLTAAGSLLMTLTAYAGNHGLRTSIDSGAAWVYQLNVGANDLTCSAGGIGYLLSGYGYSTFRTHTSANPAGTARDFGVAQQWRKVLHNGARWLVVNDAGTMALWSANGLDGWTNSAGLAAAVTNLPTGTRQGFTLGGRFIVVTMAEGTLSAIYSDDANAWTVGTVGAMEPTGLRVSALGATAAELGGVLYIPVKLTDGTSYWNALVATDGTKFKWLPTFWRGTEALPTIRTRVGGGGLIFNGTSQAGMPAAARFESNPDAMEVYLAI